MERIGWTIIFNTVAVMDRIKNTKHKNRNGPRSKDKPSGRMQNKGRETGKETKQTTQVDIGRDEEKQMDETKNQNVGENRYVKPSTEGGRD